MRSSRYSWLKPAKQGTLLVDVSVAMDRHETRIDAVDLDNDERWQFRLDRIVHAEPLPAPGSPAEPSDRTREPGASTLVLKPRPSTTRSRWPR